MMWHSHKEFGSTNKLGLWTAFFHETITFTSHSSPTELLNSKSVKKEKKNKKERKKERKSVWMLRLPSNRTKFER